MPQFSLAQTEEDILNSIGSELDDESAKKKAAAKIEKEYNALKSKATSYYKSKRYDKAKEYYNQMLALKPDSDYVVSQLALIDEKMAAQKEAEAEKKYQTLITQGDALLTNEKWAEASAKYNSALSIKAGDSYAKSQLSKITTLKAAAEKAAAEAVIQKKYNSVLALAETALAAKNWDVAKQKFEAAAAIKPNEAYPREKAAQVNLLRAEAIAKAKKAKLEKDYKLQLAKADQLFSTHKWDLAIKEYGVASGLKPNETYPKEQVKKANERIKIDADKKAELEQIETDFTKFKKLGEDALAKKNWVLAIESFTTASALKPTNSDILGLINEAKSSKKAADDVALREKAAAEAKVKTQKQFDSEMATGNQALKAKNWEVARASFLKAKSLKPDESSTAQKLEELATLIAAEKKEKADAQAKLEAEKEAEKLRLAEEARIAKEKEEAAKAAEAEAIRLAAVAKSEEEARIKEEKRLADEAAKAAEAERLAIEAEEKAKKEEAARIAAQELAAKEAAKAEEERLAAEKADKAEKERLLKISEDKKAAEEAAKIAALAAVAEQERLAEEAKTAAIAASKLKAEQEAIELENQRIAAENAAAEKERIEEEQKAVALAKAEADAMQLKEAELAKEKAEEAERIELARKQKEFNKAVDEYNEAIKNSEWDLALRALTSATAFFPENDKVIAMQSELIALQDAEKNELKLAQQKANEAKLIIEKYSKLIKSGDAALAKDNWKEAKSSYKDALATKPDEEYPKNQIRIIEQKELAANKEVLENQRKLDVEYSEFMAQGDAGFASAIWEQAKQNYTKALKVRPNDVRAVAKLKEVDAKIQQEKNLQSEKEELEKDYQERLRIGQMSMDNKKYAEAKRFFFGASKLKPSEQLPKDKLAEIEILWQEQVAAEKQLAEQEQKANLEAKFIGLIEAGDAHFGNEQYDKSIENYRGALALKPADEYAISQMTLAKKEKALDQEKEEKDRIATEERLRKEEKKKALALAKAEKEAQLEAEFKTAMESGDLATAEGRKKESVSWFKKAVQLKPEDSVANRKLRNAEENYKEERAVELAKNEERSRLAAIELEKRKEEARIVREAYLAEINKYTPEELAKNYSDGITEEIETENELIVTKSIIVEDGLGRYLIRFDYPWGEHFYYLNGKKIRADAYNWNIRNYKF